MKDTIRLSKSAILATVLATSTLDAGAQTGSTPEPATGWAIPAPFPPRVHVVKGLWWEYFRLTEAMSAWGGPALSCSYQSGGRVGSKLRYYPSSPDELASHNLILAANVNPATFTPAGLTNLEQFVKAGGGLFLFGGPFAFSGSAGTPMDRLLPFAVTNRLKSEHGLVLTPGTGAKDILPHNLAWSLKPTAFYYHPVELKQGARTLVTAGDKPVLVVWEYGKGRVAALALSAEGEQGPADLAFWEWGDMPRLVASVSEWLVAGQRSAAQITQVTDAAARQTLNSLAIMSTGKNEKNRAARLAELTAKCRDKAFALELTTAINTLEDTPDRRLIEDVADAVKPYADASFSTVATALIESGDVGKAALGLRLQGMIKQEGTAARLIKILTQGMNALSQEQPRDTSLFEPLGGAAGTPLDANERIKLAAAQAAGDLGDTACIEALQRAGAAFSSKRSQLGEDSLANETSEAGYQQCLASRCLLGDTKAVPLLIAAMLRDADLIHQYNNCGDDMLLYAKKNNRAFMHDLKLAATSVPLILRRQKKCLETLRQMPYSVLPGVITALTDATDPDTVRFAFAALAETPTRTLTPQTVSTLLPLMEGSTFPEIRRLVFQKNLDRNNGKLTPESRDVILRLAASTNVAAARFALQIAPQLEARERDQILTASAKHPAPEIRRLAELSLQP